MTDLLPCPFCGWGARLESRVSQKLPPEYHVACFGDCEVSPSVWRGSEAEAIAVWNRRAASHPPQSAERVRKALRAKVEEIRARVEKTICPTFSSDGGDQGEQGRISRQDFDTLVLAALADEESAE